MKRWLTSDNQNEAQNTSLIEITGWIGLTALVVFLIYLIIRRYRQSYQIRRIKQAIGNYIQQKRSKVIFQKQLSESKSSNNFVSVEEDTIMGHSYRNGEPYSPTGNLWEESKLQTKNSEQTVDDFDDSQEAQQYKAHSQNFQQKIFAQNDKAKSKGSTSVSKLRRRLEQKVKSIEQAESVVDQTNLSSQEARKRQSGETAAEDDDEFALGSQGSESNSDTQ